MKRLLFTLVIIGFVSFKSLGALTSYQQEVLDGAIEYVDTLLNRFMEQPHLIQGIYLKYDKIYELVEDKPAPGEYNLEYIIEGDQRYIKWGGGQRFELKPNEEGYDFTIKNSDGGKIRIVVWGWNFLPENSTTETGLKINYVDYTGARKFLNPIVDVRNVLNYLNINKNPTLYHKLSNQIWNLYIGSLVKDNVTKLEDIGAGYNTAENLQKDEGFQKFVTGLSAALTISETIIKHLVSEQTIELLLDDINAAVDVADAFGFMSDEIYFAFKVLIDPRGLILVWVVEFVEYVKLELNAFTLAEDAYASYWSKPSYSDFMNSGINPDGNLNSLKYKCFFNLSNSNIPGYAGSGFGDWSNQGYPIRINEVNNLSVCFFKLDRPLNNYFIIVSLYDPDYGTIGYYFLKSSDIDISWTQHIARFDFGLFFPESFINQNCWIKLDFYQEDSFLGNYWFKPQLTGNLSDSPPASPSNFTSSLNNESKTVDLSWDPNTEEDFNDYQIYRTTTQQEILTAENLIYQGTTNSFSDVNLMAGDTYFYQIVATDIDGNKSNATATKIEIPPLNAEFIAYQQTGTIPHNPTFVNSSSGFYPIVLFQWDFNGDEIIDLETTENTSPKFTYNELGFYDVSLTVTDQKGLVVKTSKQEHVRVFPEGSAKVLMFPENDEYEINELIKIPVNISDIDGLYAFAADFSYNPEVLKFNGISEGDCISGGNENASFLNYFDNKSEGIINIGLTRNDTSTVVVLDTSNLFTLYFEPISTIEKTEISFLDNIGVLGKDGTYKFPCSYNNYYIEIHGSDRSSKLYVESNNGTPSVLDTVSVSIEINDVNNLWAYDFELNYNSEILEILNCSKGDIFAKDNLTEAFIYDQDSNDRIHIGSTILNETTGVFTNDKRILATIHFRVINTGYSELKIINENLILPNATETIGTRTYNSDLLILPVNQSTKVELCPSKTKYPYGDKIQIAYTIENTEDLFSLSSDILFDQDSLSFLKLIETPLLSSNGDVSTTLLKSLQTDRLIIGYSRMDQSAKGINVVEPDTLFYLEFTPILQGKSRIKLENTSILNSVAETNGITILSDTVIVVNYVPVIEFISNDTILSNDSLVFTLSQLEFYDQDDSINDISYYLLEGDNYLVSDSLIIPAENYIGNLKIPIQIYDGYNYSLIDSLTLVVKERPQIEDNLIIENYFLDNGASDCLNAIQTITVSGNGNQVTITNGASTNFIAGQSITFLPGFHAEAGSYVDAHITTDGSFCDQLPQAIVAVSGSDAKTQQKSDPVNDELNIDTKAQIKVYPNPNNGSFTVELDHYSYPAKLMLHDTSGRIVLNCDLTEKSTDIDLQKVKQGMYLMQVFDQNQRCVQKLIINQ